jgi:hypothetical protein
MVAFSLFDFQQGRVDSNKLDATHLLISSTNLSEGWPLVFKSLLDIIASSSLLMLLAATWNQRTTTLSTASTRN